MEKININNNLRKSISKNSELGKKISSGEAKKLYNIYQKNKNKILIYSGKYIKELRKQIGGTGDLLKASDWKKIKSLIDNSSSGDYKVNKKITNKRNEQIKKEAIKHIEKNYSELPDNEKRKLFKTIQESQGIKKDCYSFVYYIAKKLKKELPILNEFLSYNSKYNTKANGYKGSMTQFLRKFEKTKSQNFNSFINTLKSAPDNSIFLVSMNTKGKPYYEHTGFISIENGKIYFTHGETFKKSGAQGAKKTEIKEKGGYFSTSRIRQRYKNGYFNLKRIV